MPTLPEPYAARASRVPQATADSLPAVELLARLIQVEQYEKSARTAPAELARGYSTLSSAVLKALPRDELEGKIAALRKSAAGSGGSLVGDLYALIAELKAANPQPGAEAWAEAQRRVEIHKAAEKARIGAAMRRRAGRVGTARSGAGPAVTKAAVDRAVRAAVAPQLAKLTRLEAEAARLAGARAAAEQAAAAEAKRAGDRGR